VRAVPVSKNSNVHISTEWQESLGECPSESGSTQKYFFGGPFVANMNGMFRGGHYYITHTRIPGTTFFESNRRHVLSKFNQPIGGWDVSKVTDMNRMFANSDSFNQDISAWNVARDTDIGYMFYDAVSFNGDFRGHDYFKPKPSIRKHNTALSGDCCICTETYDSIVTLHASKDDQSKHLVCIECFTNLTSNKTEVPCPVCRYIFNPKSESFM
jgi:surface protein